MNEISKDMTHTTRTVLDADWLIQICQLKRTRFSDFQSVNLNLRYLKDEITVIN